MSIEAPGGRDDELAYRQVADDIAQRISSGELQQGARLLGERALAEHYGRSVGVIRNAMEVLRRRGLVYTRHGRGTFIGSEPDA